jgi:SAM-dependent methyltransferase
LQTVLDLRFPYWEYRIVHESSPANDFIARYATRYSASQYFDDVPRGQSRGGVRSENIEDLTFDDDSIDLFITQDVMEHVFHPELAIREIHRVLRPGGAHVFTTPKHKHLLKTVQRARIDRDGTVEHLLEAEYHGNPIGDRSLVTYDFGYDFEQLLAEWSGVSVEAVHTLDRGRGLDAEYNEVFVIAKPGPRSILHLREITDVAVGRAVAVTAKARRLARRARRGWQTAAAVLFS